MKDFKELIRANSLDTSPEEKDIAAVDRLIEDIFPPVLNEKRCGAIAHPSRWALPVGFNRAGETMKKLIWGGEVAP